MERRKEYPAQSPEFARLVRQLRKPVSRQEIERRRNVIAETLKIRAQMPPLGFSVTELIRQIREGREYDE